MTLPTLDRTRSRLSWRIAALLAVAGAPAVALAASVVTPPPDSIMIDGQSYTVKTLASPQREARTGSFDRDAQSNHLRGHVTSCAEVIAIPVGVAGGDVSYGGTCLLDQDGQTSSAEVCNDEKLGLFKLVPVQGAKPTHKDLTAFVAANCFGG
ncbi:MAG TPA: hypothetical protein VNT30_15060 [Stellaceae bacterium]|nr:hypothetical protein [Stellaceae bacterium]